MNVVVPSCRRGFSPHKYWNQVEPSAVQQVLRKIFACWGRPQRFRVDNGAPWGSAGDWPTDLALWLIGLGVAMIWNPPRRPQHNGVVERSQGTGKRWGEPPTCADPAELQRRLDQMDRIQREVYPSIAGQSRWQAFAGLQQVTRPYSRTWEKGHWDLALVLAHLADYSVSRQVDCKGQVSVYNRNHYVGKRYAGQALFVQLDPVDREWVFSTPQGLQLRRKAAEEITRERIQKLCVTHRR